VSYTYSQLKSFSAEQKTALLDKADKISLLPQVNPEYKFSPEEIHDLSASAVLLFLDLGKFDNVEAVAKFKARCQIGVNAENDLALFCSGKYIIDHNKVNNIKPSVDEEKITFDLFKRAFASNSENIDACVDLGLMFFHGCGTPPTTDNNANYSRALELFDKGLKIHPNHSRAQYFLASMYYQGKGTPTSDPKTNKEMAYKLVKQSITSNSQNDGSLFLLAKMHLSNKVPTNPQNNYQEAFDLLIKAFRINPQRILSFHKIVALVKEGPTFMPISLAYNYFKDILAITPNNSSALTELQFIKDNYPNINVVSPPSASPISQAHPALIPGPTATGPSISSANTSSSVTLTPLSNTQLPVAYTWSQLEKFTPKQKADLLTKAENINAKASVAGYKFSAEEINELSASAVLLYMECEASKTVADTNKFIARCQIGIDAANDLALCSVATCPSGSFV
jgi:tetratricopeptide (TPR) repeat protein